MCPSRFNATVASFRGVPSLTRDRVISSNTRAKTNTHVALVKTSRRFNANAKTRVRKTFVPRNWLA